MPQRSLPSFEILWERHERLYREIFSNALQELSKRESLSGDENTISAALSVILNKVCMDISRLNNHDVQTPIWEAPIAPKSESELKGVRSWKRPDFTCKCLNPGAQSPEEYEISLHVECKRLGNPTSVSWNLNENYVINGIKRFDCSTHEYGKRAPSGMMIGYIVSMSPAEIETEVNGYQTKHLPHNARLTFKSNVKPLFQTHQKIQRRHVEPVRFQLIHLWIDLRDK
jgi:hypothetical protein